MIDNLSIVIPYRDERAALKRLLATLPAGLPVIVVDDQSDVLPEVDGAQVKVIRPSRRGFFAGACNAGIAACDSDVVIMNQDVWFDDDRWQAVIEQNRAEYALIGHSSGGHPAWPNNYVQGDFMYMSRVALRAIGGLDEERFPLWGCTCEWQLKACRKGYKALPLAEIPGMHHEERHGSRFGAAITKALAEQPGERERFIRTPPLVSVIIPSYDHGKYLPDALHSLLGGETALGQMPGQTFQAFEVIVVDDASTDNTAEVMRQYASGWAGIRYIRHKQNRGTAAALNTGIAASYGTYFQVLGADDMLEPEALETTLSVMEKNPGRFAYAYPIAFTHGQRGPWWLIEEYDFEKELRVNQVPAGIMARKEDWQRVGGYPEEFRSGREDWAIAVALGRAGVCGVRIPQPLYLYRRDGQNRTLRNSGTEHARRFLGMMQARFPDVYGGERPMGCCGGGKRNMARTGGVRTGMDVARTPALARNVGPLPGPMVEVEYIGAAIGKRDEYGDVSKLHYVFDTGKRKIAYVDQRDVAGLLAKVYDRAPAYRLHETPKAPEPVQALPTVPPPEAQAEPVAVAQAGPVLADDNPVNEGPVKVLPKRKRAKSQKMGLDADAS